jgi:3'-phosphoadenosine 5'-phosphosulfate sulfotransferase (PAPS reductase)/FAD synthetase/predicted RNA-binding protein with PUA domain
MREPPVKKLLYWCRECNVPLIGKTCGCGAEGIPLELLQPYDVRPALAADMEIIRGLIKKRFGVARIPRIILLNKTGGTDRKDLVIANGARLGWLSFDPFRKCYSFDLAFEGLPFLLSSITRGIVDIGEHGSLSGKRIGGKKVPVRTTLPDGSVVVRTGKLHGVGQLTGGFVRIRQIGVVQAREGADPEWSLAVERNRYHLHNLERNAVRFIRQHMHDRPEVNVSFSGGKDSTVALELARRAGINTAYFVNTGLEFPETLEFVAGHDLQVRLSGGDFWKKVRKAGPPKKDNRWCCEFLKLEPVKEWREKTGPCVTVQGNRWYESFARASLPSVAVNPFNPAQVNISPIRNWRALEVFLYIWWRELPINPLYELGFERVGCWMCPAMLESESEHVKSLHPELYSTWIEFLREYYKGRHYPEQFFSCGLWRWDVLPPKMREQGISGIKKNSYHRK